jgi:quinol monooxygenase YgiN
MRRFLPRMALSVVACLVLLTGAHADNASGGEGDRPSSRGPIFDITHFDVIPLMPPQVAIDFQQTAYTALFAYRDASRSDRGFESFRVVNWLLASNHSQIIDVWSSLEAFEEHLAQPHSIGFRFAVQVQPPPPPPGFNCCIGSPIDDRQYSMVKSFGTPWVSNSLPSTVGSGGGLFVVTYVDFLEEVLEADPDRGQQELERYGAASIKANSGHLLNYTALQQLDRPNRAAVLEVWDSPDNYTAWQSSKATTDFLNRVTPLLGSPLDHRLNILCGESFVDGTGCVPP